jgi:hypothetical protein
VLKFPDQRGQRVAVPAGGSSGELVDAIRVLGPASSRPATTVAAEEMRDSLPRECDTDAPGRRATGFGDEDMT